MISNSKIHNASLFNLMKVGKGIGIGYDGHFKAILGWITTVRLTPFTVTELSTVRYPFFCHLLIKRIDKGVIPTATCFLHFLTFSLIHMSLYNMSVETAVQRHAALEEFTLLPISSRPRFDRSSVSLMAVT